MTYVTCRSSQHSCAKLSVKRYFGIVFFSSSGWLISTASMMNVWQTLYDSKDSARLLSHPEHLLPAAMRDKMYYLALTFYVVELQERAVRIIRKCTFDAWATASYSVVMTVLAIFTFGAPLLA